MCVCRRISRVLYTYSVYRKCGAFKKCYFLPSSLLFYDSSHTTIVIRARPSNVTLIAFNKPCLGVSSSRGRSIQPNTTRRSYKTLGISCLYRHINSVFPSTSTALINIRLHYIIELSEHTAAYRPLLYRWISFRDLCYQPYIYATILLRYHWWRMHNVFSENTQAGSKLSRVFRFHSIALLRLAVECAFGIVGRFVTRESFGRFHS